MPKASKRNYYAVRIGRSPGIYSSWDECQAQVKGFPNALFKKLNTEAEAVRFMTARPSSRSSASHEINPVPSTSRLVPLPPHAPTIAEDVNDCDVVYCDGACKGNGQAGSVAGIGVWWGHGDPRNISERCPGDQTNNRAELIAIVRILETAPRLKRRLLIKTDSKYSIQCVTVWIFNWINNGFISSDGKPVKNRALIKYLAALLHARRRTSQTVEFEHVLGHVGIEGNEAADQLANLGTTMPVVSEPNWERLERQVLQSLKPVEPLVDNNLEAYADGLLSDTELTNPLNSSTSDVTLPTQERQSLGKGKNAARSHPVVPSISHVFPPSSATGVGARQGNRTPMRGSMSTTAMSRDELEMYASCLLDPDELSALGKNGDSESGF